MSEEESTPPVVKNYYALSKEITFDSKHEEAFRQCLDRLSHPVQEADGLPSMEELEAELLAIQQQTAAAREERFQIEQQRLGLAQRLHESRCLQDALIEQLNGLELENREYCDEIVALDDESERISAQLERYMQINSLNDAFHIWYAGPYGTINNFRLGNLAIKPIDSNEINAALGQAALLVFVLANKLGVDFKNYLISPLGSFARIIKADNKKTIYPLHLDASSFTLYPKWNFNQALIGFMACIQELGDYTGEMDPTLGMPYKISLSDSKIGEACFTYGSDEEAWSRAMKFMLSNIKWLVAWATKHAQTPFSS